MAPEWEQLCTPEDTGDGVDGWGTDAGGGGEGPTEAAGGSEAQATADAKRGPSGGSRRLRAHSAAAGGAEGPNGSSRHSQLTDTPGSESGSAGGAVTSMQSGGRLLDILDTLAPHHVAHHVAVRGRLLAGGSLAGEQRYGVSVHLLPVVPAEALEAAEVDWPAAMAAALARRGPDGGGGVQGGNGTNSSSDGGGGDGGDGECYPVVVAPREVRTGHVLNGTRGPGAAVLDVYLCEKVRHGALYGTSYKGADRHAAAARVYKHRTALHHGVAVKPHGQSHVFRCTTVLRCWVLLRSPASALPMPSSLQPLSTFPRPGPSAGRAVAGAPAAGDVGGASGAAAAG